MPKSDDEQQSWFFDELPHRILTVEKLNRIPTPGHMTAERSVNDFSFAFSDHLPPGTIYTMTIIFKPQDVIANHLGGIIHACVGTEDDSVLAAEEAAHAKRQIAKKNKFYPVAGEFLFQAAIGV